jgi:REP element-mobilizing transposase RayT
MNLSAIGRYASEALSLLPNHYSNLEVLQFVVMPNHIHAILSITESDTIPQSRERLGVVIGGFKQSVTMFARKNNLSFEWQKRYHDHIIRDVHDGNRIADYIDSNVAKWSSDCFY